MCLHLYDTFGGLMDVQKLSHCVCVTLLVMDVDVVVTL